MTNFLIIQPIPRWASPDVQPSVIFYGVGMYPRNGGTFELCIKDDDGSLGLNTL